MGSGMNNPENSGNESEVVLNFITNRNLPCGVAWRQPRRNVHVGVALRGRQAMRFEST